MRFGFAPKGWALCTGQLPPINQNQAMSSLQPSGRNAKPLSMDRTIVTAYPMTSPWLPRTIVILWTRVQLDTQVAAVKLRPTLSAIEEPGALQPRPDGWEAVMAVMPRRGEGVAAAESGSTRWPSPIKATR